jgi:hypothetical protein
MVISAAAVFTFNFNMSADVELAGTVIVEINNVNYTNAQTLNFSWGTVVAGEHTQAIKIYNQVNTAVTPSIQATGLPSGWTLTLSDTSAIPAYGTVTRNMVLTVPSNPIMGSYSWSATLNVATS